MDMIVRTCNVIAFNKRWQGKGLPTINYCTDKNKRDVTDTEKKPLFTRTHHQ